MIGNSSLLPNRREFHFLYEQPRTFLCHLMKNNCSTKQGVKIMTHTRTHTLRDMENLYLHGIKQTYHTVNACYLS